MSASLEANTAGLQQVIGTKGPSIVSRLETIAATSKPSEMDRYLVVSQDGGSRYAQCLFILDDEYMLCEVSSGWYGSRRREDSLPFVSPEGLAALAELGFHTEVKRGNYQMSIKLDRENAFEQVAAILLAGLYRGHGLDPDTPLQITAPLVDRFDDKSVGGSANQSSHVEVENA